MTRRRKILLLALCGLIAVGAICFFTLREREPSYNGRTLSEWLEEYNATWEYDSSGNLLNLPRHGDPSILAVRAIGTNAIPMLLHWASANDSALVRALDTGLTKLPERVGNWFAPTVWKKTAMRQHMLANSGFEILGTNAVAAVPQLKQIFEDPNRDDIDVAAFCLRCTGRAGLEVFAQAISNNQKNAQFIAVVKQIGQMTKGDTNAEPIVEACLKVLQSSNLSPHERRYLISVLGHLALDPKRCIPAITNQYRSQQSFVRAAVVNALWRYGSNATPALPVVRAALDDSDHDVKIAAGTALAVITGQPPTNAAPPRMSAEEEAALRAKYGLPPRN